MAVQRTANASERPGAACKTAEAGDDAPFERLPAALAAPFDVRSAFASLAEPAPAEVTADYRTFRGT